MDKIGKYEILEKIGTGGFGVVFKGRDPFIKRYVAIKTCHSDSEEMRKRFFREAEIAGNLQHKNVTTVYDFGFEGELPYLVQEYLPGEDLDQVMARRVLTDAQKLDYLIQVANGLAYAHDQGVIHRDIKPSNVRVVEGGRVKIMDFGIAKLAHLESQLTKTGMTLGTASYLAPEQIRGDELTRAVDIFAFGVMAYELWAHRRPFEGASLSNLFYQVLSAQPPPLRSFAPDCPPQLAAVVERCLAKEPGDRWPSFDSLVLALEGIRGLFPEVSHGETAERTRVLPVGTAREDEEGTRVLTGAAAREEIARVETRVDELLAAGNPTAAEIEVTLAQKRFAGTPGALGSLAPLLARVSEERTRRESERRRSDKVDGLLTRGRELAAAGSHDEAALLLRTVLELAPDHAEARELLQASEEAAAAEKKRLAEDRQRRAQTEAQERERQARADEEERERQARADEEERERRARAEAEQRRQRELAEAEEQRQRELAEAEEKRRRALAEAAAAVSARLARGELTSAEGEIGRLEREHAGAPEIVALRQELDRRRRETQAASLRQEADRYLRRGDPTSSARLLHDALRLVPGDADLLSRLREVERRVEEKQAAEARAGAVAEAVAQVEGAIEGRRLSEAAGALERASAQLGAAPELDRLRSRLAAEHEAERLAEEERRRVEEERRRAEEARRLARMAELGTTAAERRAAGDLGGAIEALEAALQLGSDPALFAQLAGDRAELQRQREEAARQQRIAGAVLEVEAALAAGKAKAARKALKKATSTLGADAALAALEPRVEAALHPPEVVKPTPSPRAEALATPDATTIPTPTLPAVPGRRLLWVGAAAAAVALVIVVVALSGGETSKDAGNDAGPGPAASTAPPDTVEPGTLEPVATQASLPPTIASPVPSAAPPASTGSPRPPPVDEGAARAAQAVSRSRARLAAGDPPGALREAVAAAKAAPSDPKVVLLRAELLRSARGTAEDSARRALAARAADLAPRELAAAVTKRRAAEAAAASRPLEAARDLWESAALFDRAGTAAAAEARRRALAQQTPVPVPSAAPPRPTPAATLAQPVHTPEPVATQRPPPPTDETAGVRAALARYQQAMERLDFGAVQKVFPAVPPRLRDVFDDMAALRMTLDCRDIRVDGSSATAACFRSQEMRPKAGKSQSDNRQVRIRLHREGDAWVIDAFE